MAKKKQSNGKSDRSDPKVNKSLAIRMALRAMPGAKATEIAAEVEKRYGHDIRPNMVYMIKTKVNMAADGRPKASKSSSGRSPLTTPALWVSAIKSARELIKATGSVANATALLKAIDS